ncbi:MAG: glycosyltransferase [Dehalococcoidia bacterium]|nr:glycosyltransferase [Dehalococcoidia bacterium]MDH4366596.1 glycosyltransferase [Dehalococcoidia bacterium]
MAKKKMLAIPGNDIFLKRDIEILRNHFDIRTAPGFNRRRPITTTFRILKGTLWADLTFCHFAGTHAFLAVLFSKIFGKKSLVIVGGYEVAKLPEIGYGSMSQPIYAPIVRFVLNHADKLFAVSEFNKEEILKYAKPKNVRVVYGSNIIDYNKFRPSGEKEELVITTGFIKQLTIKRKGFETFVKSAEYMPEVKFALIGDYLDDSIAYLKSVAPPNVTFTGPAGRDEVLRWCQKAKVYCQLSYYESFGVALAEAMACGCVPVVTNKGALPEVVDDTGFYVPYGDAEVTAEAIKKALNSDNGKQARERIRQMFPTEKLQRELVSEVEELLK